MADLVVWIVVLAMVVIVISRSVRIVPQANAGIVERLGRYTRTLHPGISVIAPFVDKVRYHVDLREQMISLPQLELTTQDDRLAHVDLTVYVQVADARQAVYEIANYLLAIEQATVTALQDLVGSLTSEQLMMPGQGDTISRRLHTTVDGKARQWGVIINNVKLMKPSLPPPAPPREEPWMLS